MAVKLDALIKKTEAAIASESDPKKLARLKSTLGSFLATKAEIDGDDDEDDKDKGDEDDDGDESAAAKHAERARKLKAKSEALKHRAKAAEHKKAAAESEEEAKKCEEEAAGSEEDDEDEARNRAATPSALTEGAAAAIASQADLGRDALARIEKLEKSAQDRERLAMIAEAKATRRITPNEAKTLGGKSMAFVRDFLEMRPKPLVATDDGALAQPDGSPAGDIPENVKAFIEQGIQAMGIEGEKAEAYRKASVDAHRKAMSKTNGVY